MITMNEEMLDARRESVSMYSKMLKKNLVKAYGEDEAEKIFEALVPSFPDGDA